MMDLPRFFFMNSLGAHNAYNAKFCLCTSGGGARAMTHTMGVYRALHEMGILEEVDGMSPSIRLDPSMALDGDALDVFFWKMCWDFYHSIVTMVTYGYYDTLK